MSRNAKARAKKRTKTGGRVPGGVGRKNLPEMDTASATRATLCGVFPRDTELAGYQIAGSLAYRRRVATPHFEDERAKMLANIRNDDGKDASEDAAAADGMASWTDGIIGVVHCQSARFAALVSQACERRVMDFILGGGPEGITERLERLAAFFRCRPLAPSVRLGSSLSSDPILEPSPADPEAYAAAQCRWEAMSKAHQRILVERHGSVENAIQQADARTAITHEQTMAETRKLKGPEIVSLMQKFGAQNDAPMKLPDGGKTEKPDTRSYRRVFQQVNGARPAPRAKR